MITILPIARGDDSYADALLRIYQSALDVSEQKPASAIRALLCDERYAVIGALNDTELLGFVISIFPPAADFWLLEYMAVSEHARSMGIGGLLFRAAREAAERRSPGLPCLIEVDQIGCDSRAAVQRDRRLRFYARHGCRHLVNLNYIMPAVAGVAPPIMHLLIYGLAGTHYVPLSQLHLWLTTIYREVYVVWLAADDPRK